MTGVQTCALPICFAAAVPPAVGTLVLAVGVFAVEWALFWFLKRQQVFLRV